MAHIESKLASLGLVLPAPLKPPSGVVLPFAMVRVVGTRAFVSGHGPQNADGTLAHPLGKVGSDLTIEQGYAAARLVALSIFASLQRALGETQANDAAANDYDVGHRSSVAPQSLASWVQAVSLEAFFFAAS